MSGRSALIVASETYSDQKLQQLRAPARDAEELARVLRDESIGAFEVSVSVDESESIVRRKLERFFQNRDRDDVLLLHFSCHGIKDDEGHLYFAMPDTDTHSLDSTAVSAEFVERQIRRSRSRRIVLLLDCCYSGAFARGSHAKAGGAVDLRERFEGRGRAILTASSAMEYAFEGDDVTGEGRPSVFTEALVRGLASGEADRDEDGLISVDELYDHVFDEVRDRTPKQAPGKWSDVEGQLIIARSVRPVIVKPAELPHELREAAAHPVTDVREGAVRALLRLAARGDARMVLAVRLALESMRDDDSKRVSEVVAGALLELPSGEMSTAPQPGQAPLTPAQDPSHVDELKGQPTVPPSAAQPRPEESGEPTAGQPPAGTQDRHENQPPPERSALSDERQPSAQALRSPDSAILTGPEPASSEAHPASVALAGASHSRTEGHSTTLAIWLVVVGVLVNILALAVASVRHPLNVPLAANVWIYFETIMVPMLAAAALLVSVRARRRGLALGIALGLTIQTTAEYVVPLVAQAGVGLPLSSSMPRGALVAPFIGALLMLAAAVAAFRASAPGNEDAAPVGRGRRDALAVVMLAGAAPIVATLFLPVVTRAFERSLYSLDHWFLVEPLIGAGGICAAAVALLLRAPGARLWAGLGVAFSLQTFLFLLPFVAEPAFSRLQAPSSWGPLGLLGAAAAAAASLAAVLDRREVAIVEPDARTLRTPLLIAGAGTLLGLLSLRVGLTWAGLFPSSGWWYLEEIGVPTAMLLGLGIVARLPERRPLALGAVAAFAVVSVAGYVADALTVLDYTDKSPDLLDYSRIASAAGMAAAAAAVCVAYTRVARSHQESALSRSPQWLFWACVSAAAAVTLAALLPQTSGGSSFQQLDGFLIVGQPFVGWPVAQPFDGWLVVQPLVAAVGIALAGTALRLSSARRDLWLGVLVATGSQTIVLFAPYFAEPLSQGQLSIRGAFLGLTGGAVAVIAAASVLLRDHRSVEVPAVAAASA
jgi:hypothetical protein